MTVDFIGNTVQQTLGIAGVTSVTFSVDTDTTAGNTLIACCGVIQGSAPVTVSMSDSQGNTWVIDNGPKQSNGNHVFMASTAQDHGPLSSLSDTITVTYSHPIGSSVLLDVREFSGLLTPRVIDGAGSNYSASTKGPIDSGSLTPTANSDLIVTTFATRNELIDTAPNAHGTVGFYDYALSLSSFGAVTQDLTTAHQILVGGKGVLQRHCITMSKATSVQGLIALYDPQSLAAMIVE